MLELSEEEMNPEKIKETADKFEVLKVTTKGINKTLEDKVGGRAQQIKGQEGGAIYCFKCQKPGHMKLQCKTPKAQLKCTHCDTTGRQNTNDYCKDRQKELTKDKAEQPGKAKANKVEGRDDSPIGGDDDKTEKANLVDATEEGEETDSS